MFTRVGEVLGLPVSGPVFRRLIWGHYDGNGYPDLLAGATSPQELTRVFRNLEGEGFVDVADEIGLTLPGRSARPTNWTDYDNDGELNVYSAGRIADNRLFRNDDGLYAEVFVRSGPTDAPLTLGGFWFGLDQKGRLNLRLASQSGATDAL